MSLVEAQSERRIEVPAHDGRHMPAFMALPPSGRGPGLVVLQEIFGVTGYIKARLRTLAGLGYVALAPDLYWRIAPGIAIDERTEAGLQQAFGYVQQLDLPRTVDDAVAALEHLKAMPETAGRAGVLGFCFGGSIAYEVAVQAEPDVAVCYYGSGIADRLSEAAKVACPVIFHFGAADQFLPVEQARCVRDAFASRENAEVYIHEGGGHAFDNHDSTLFHQPGPAAVAWGQTAAFLQKWLPAETNG